MQAHPELFSDGLYSLTSGKSLFIRIDTPSLSPIAEAFEVQREKIVAGLKAIGKLADWFNLNSLALEGFFTEPTTSEDDLNTAFEVSWVR